MKKNKLSKKKISGLAVALGLSAGAGALLAGVLPTVLVAEKTDAGSNLAETGLKAQSTPVPDQAAVNAEQIRINGLTPTGNYYFDPDIAAVTDRAVTDPAELTAYKIPFTTNPGFTYSYSLNALSDDGTLNVTIKVSNGTVDGTPAPIAVKAVKTNWTAITQELNKLTTSSWAREDFAASSWWGRPTTELYRWGLGSTTADRLVNKSYFRLFFDKSAGSAVLTFRLVQGVSSTGAVVATANVTVTNFPTDQELVDREQNRVNAIPSVNKRFYFDNSQPAIIDAEATNAALAAYGINLTTNYKFTYTYSATALSADSTEVQVSIKVQKGTAVGTPTPIDAHAISTNWAAIKSKIAALADAASTKSLTEFRAVDKTNQDLTDLLSDLGLTTDLASLVPTTLNLRWSKPQGTTAITFQLYDGTTDLGADYASSVTVAIAPTDQELVDEEQAVVNALVSDKTIYFDDTLPAVSDAPATTAALAAYNIAFTPKPDLVYTYSTTGLNADGNTSVLIKVAKGAVSGTPAPIAATGVRTNWTNIQAFVKALTGSSLSETAFQAVDKSNQPLTGFTTDLGIAADFTGLVGGGVTLVWSKSATKSVVTFDLYQGGTFDATATKLGTVDVTVEEFDLSAARQAGRQATKQAEKLLEAMTASSLYEADFRQLLVLEGTALDAGLAAKLGIPLPTLPSGVTTTASKAVGSDTVVFKSTSGTGADAYTTTTTVVFAKFKAPEPSADSSSPDVGAIVGGTIGGVAGAGLVAGLTYYMIKRKKKKAL